MGKPWEIQQIIKNTKNIQNHKKTHKIMKDEGKDIELQQMKNYRKKHEKMQR